MDILTKASSLAERYAQQTETAPLPDLPDEERETLEEYLHSAPSSKTLQDAHIVAAFAGRNKRTLELELFFVIPEKYSQHMTYNLAVFISVGTMLSNFAYQREKAGFKENEAFYSHTFGTTDKQAEFAASVTGCHQVWTNPDQPTSP